MADAAISATIEVALGTIISLASERIGLVRGFEKELESLSRYAHSIQRFLADADSNIHSPAVKDWLFQLQDEVLEAENVLDELNYENLRREVKYRNQFKKKVCSFFSFCNTIGFRCRFASKIRDINTNFERINGKANELGLVFRYQIEATLLADHGATTSRQTDSVPAPNVVGRSEDESKIVKMLLSSSERPLSLLPIIGMGGLGKTTLAKSIYNNPQIERHFRKRIWVCVAKKIEIMDLFKFILESSIGEKVELNQRDIIVQKIRQALRDQRYLIVLDDVWNHEQRLWEDLLDTLEGLNRTNGSWCLITTRLEPMADTVSRQLKVKFNPYFLGKLADEECWSILKGKVAAVEEVSKDLEAIERQILRRCGGLPLAATLIGGLLHLKGKEEWRSVVEGSLLDVDPNDTCRQILKVSFVHLSPASVKKCFAYCSIFPQDKELQKDDLIELWMAEGFLQPDRKNGVMEEIGENYFKILLQSSLLEDVGYGRYKMHDLVHDFANSVLNPESSKWECYRTLDSFEGVTENTVKEIPPSIRTLFLFLEDGISVDILSKFRYLHVLKLSGSGVKMLPTSIRMLIHLRFLDISDSCIEILPKSFYKLYNLQTLTIDVENLKGLPERISKLIRLRHVHCGVYGYTKKIRMPLEIGRLTCLNTLEFFKVGKEKGRRIEELGTLKNLKGSLEIRNLELINGKKGAKSAKLFEKPYLFCLEFCWGSGDREADTYGGDGDVLEGLQPNPNLKTLVIQCFMGYRFPKWFLDLSALKFLRLYNCKRCRELPALGQLPSLQNLHCEGLENIRSIGLSFYGIIIDDEEEGRGGGSGSTINGRFFPALERLNLMNLPNLAEWKDAEQVRSATGEGQVELFPVLQKLTIINCRQLTTAPSNFPRIEYLRINWGCHVSLAEKILSNMIILRSIKVRGVPADDAQHIDSLTLEKGFNRNFKDDFHLSLEGCGGLPSGMLEHLCNCCITSSSPRSVRLKYLSELTSLRRSGFNVGTSKSLESLELEGCTNLRIDDQDVCGFQSLRKLEVGRGCPNMVSHQIGYLTSLEELTLPKDFCSSTEFDWSALKCLSALRKLYLYGSPHVESLPNHLRSLTTLTGLSLWDFGIEALPDWIGNLTSLENLGLFYCKKLRYLPSVDAMKCLSKLRYLIISNCSLLKQRCIPDNSIDSEWPKISHIPERFIH